MDVGGASALSRSALFSSIFNLVDLWTISCDPREYAAFVEALLNRISFPVQSTGTIVLRALVRADLRPVSEPYGLLSKRT